MDLTYPPGSTTDCRGRRLRLRGAALALMALVGTAGPALAREAPLTVLVAAPVSDGALGAISPQTWASDVTASLSRYHVVAYSGTAALPTPDDCRKASADYLVIASFELRPALPGLPNGSGRISARSRWHVVDCVTNAVAADDVVDFESDPLETAPGDTDAAPDSRWAHEIPASLAKHALNLQRPGRVSFVAPPLARVAFRGTSLHPGDVLRDVATAKNELRDHPILLTVTQVTEDGVDVLFDTSGDRPQPGDYVER